MSLDDRIADDRQVLPDLLAPGLRLVFCGSAAGNVSAARGAYYAHPRNRFWPTLHAVGLTPRVLQPEEFPELLSFGIGLTDLAKAESGSDDQLSTGAYDPDRLRARIEVHRPAILAFTSKRPARAFLRRARVDYGFQEERIGGTRLFVLPSPSPRNQAWWDESWWRKLADAAKAAAPLGNAGT